MSKSSLWAVGLLALLFLAPVFGPWNDASAPNADKGKYLIAVREGGKVTFKNKPGLLKAVQAYLGASYKVMNADIKPKNGKPALIIAIRDVKTGGRGVLGFELVAEGKNIFSGVTPGQKCIGNPCSECAFQNDGWGCQCNDDKSDGHCDHEIASALDPIIAETMTPF